MSQIKIAAIARTSWQHAPDLDGMFCYPGSVHLYSGTASYRSFGVPLGISAFPLRRRGYCALCCFLTILKESKASDAILSC